MDLPKLKKLKPSYKNLDTIGRVGYELTGNKYFLNFKINASFSCSNGLYFFEVYYNLLSEVLEVGVKKDFFKYNLIKFNKNGGHSKLPFIYNSI